jgi:hypothetical protein
MSAMPRFTRLVPFAAPGEPPGALALALAVLSGEFWTDTANLTL